MINKWIGIGNLTADPVMRITPTEKYVASFCVAVKRPSKQDATDFINCVAWNQTAELVSKYLHKGSKVAVEGTVTSRNYEDKNGNKRTAIEVVVASVTFLDAKQKEQATPEVGKQYAPDTETQPNGYESLDYELSTDDLPF